MGGRKKFLSLSKSLDQAIVDLAAAFEVEVNHPTRRSFIEGIRREHDRFAKLKIGDHRTLCWSREGNVRKLILQSGERIPEERARFARWRRANSVTLLHRRGIKVSLSHASLDEIRAGADDFAQ